MLIYDLGIWTYRQGVRLASHSRNVKARQLNDGLDASWEILKSFSQIGIEDRRPVVWIHAASLGEFEQGRPLIERLRRDKPGFRIVLTFFSPSGYEVRKTYPHADAVSYLPMDTTRNVRRFLDLVRPQMAIFIKYEFWLNYLKELKQRKIPTYLISGIFRESQLFFKPCGGFYRKALHAFSWLYVQDEGSQRLLERIGVKDVSVAGDTRFDRVTDIMKGVKPHPVLDRFCGDSKWREANDPDSNERDLIFIAGSSWPADEEIYGDWLRKRSGVKGIIAPHEFNSERLEKMLRFFNGEAVLLSEAEKKPAILDGKKVLVIDCFGLLASAYSYADMAYVGGGFGAGLHNINEAAVYGVPVFYGPNHNKFIEAKEMKTVGGGIAIESKAEFEEKADDLLSHPEKRKTLGDKSQSYIKSKLGATARIYSDLFN